MLNDQESISAALLYKLQSALIEFVECQDVDYASVIGVLEIMKLDVYAEMQANDDSD